jgi:Mg-chelatase subunit ChlD
MDTQAEETTRHEAQRVHDGKKRVRIKTAEGEIKNLTVRPATRGNLGFGALEIGNIQQFRHKYAGAARRFARELETIKTDVEADRRLQRRGRFDRRRMKQAVKGDDRVYYRRGTDLDQDIAVSIQIDRSSSMGYGEGSALYQAAQAATITSMALEQTEIPYEMRSFEGRQNQWQHKTFDDSQATDEQLAGMLVMGGGTPMSTALELSRTSLSVREEGVKLAFILADGYPYNPNATRAAFDAMEAQGITPILIYAYDGEMDQGAKKYLDEHVAGPGRWEHVRNPSALHRVVSDRIRDIYRNAERNK